MQAWNCQFSPQDFWITISLTWIARNTDGVNNFACFSSFLEAIFVLPMQHRKQNRSKTIVFTLEVSSRDFRWRHLSRFNAIFIMILLPMLHGEHIFAYGCKSLFMLFCASRLPWPYKALKVPFSFCCKIAMKRCFSLVGGSLVFCGSLLGLVFIKAYFRASFFAFFSFCYTSHAKRTIFKMRSGTFLAHFAIMRFTADV